MVAALILAAGKGSRFHSSLSKVLHPLGGKPMLSHVHDGVAALNPLSLVFVVSPELQDHELLAGSLKAIQEEPKGTGDAVRLGLEAIPSYHGPVLILCGDCPLIKAETLQDFLSHYQKRANHAKMQLIAMEPENPGRYGRIVQKNSPETSTEREGEVLKIVEFLDASSEEKALSLCYSGVMMADADLLRMLLPQIVSENAQKEFYFTDVVALAHAQGERVEFVTADATEFKGVNTREELSLCEKTLQQRWRKRAQAQGVSFQDPDSVFLCYDTVLGKDVEIEPFVVFGPQVILKDRVKIRSFSHIEETEIHGDVEVGPFARLRGKTILERGSVVGNFVELKQAHLGENTRVKHLSYLGDTVVGEGSNIGAGVISCNYDGQKKYPTHIGKKAFVGSNAVLVAPVTVGEGAYVAAGSVVTETVPPEALAVGRARQVNKEGWSLKKGKVTCVES